MKMLTALSRTQLNVFFCENGRDKMIDILCYRLLKDQSFLDIFVKNKARLWKVATRAKFDDSEYWRVLEMICAYHDKHKTLPTSSGLWNFVCLSKDLGVTEAWNAVLKEALNELQKMEPVRLKQCSDPNVLIEEVITKGRIENQKFIYQCGVDILIQGPSQLDEKGKKKNPTGPDDAKRYVLQELAKDIVISGDAVSGSMQQNAASIAQYLSDIYNADDKDRILTGFSQLDEAFLIGKRFMKFIGIMGFSNEGKSLFTRTLAYNFALQGHKTLYVTLEGEDALDCLTKFAFLHACNFQGQKCPLKVKGHENCTFDMPSYENWKLKQVTREQYEHVDFVLVCLKHHDVPIYVHDRKTINTWEQIEAAVESEGYEVVVIDYIGILATPDAKAKDRDFVIDAIYNKASELCGKKSVIVMSPLQVNREGKRQADSKDPHQERIYSMVHVAKFSSAYQAMDVILAVCSNPEMKQLGEIKIEVQKVREGTYPNDFFADVDTGTKHVKQLSDAAKERGKEWAKQVELQEAKMQDPDFSPM
jgi:hypothetical protein